MALARHGRTHRGVDYWPGFVDALSTLLLAIMFLLSVFVLAQFIATQEISGRDAVLDRLNGQIDELTQLLALERAGRQDVEDQIANLRASLEASQAERDRVAGLLAARGAVPDDGVAALATSERALDEQKRVSDRALSQVELLNQQIAALRQQIGALEAALEASETRDRASRTTIADLGKRLNVALAQRVQELNRYRSDFFGRLREILADRENIRIVGDRFVFQSEVLFGSGSTEIAPQGRQEMATLAGAILELAREIPADIPWVLRVDGHTDDVPVTPGRGVIDNWDLSTRRAGAIVRFLISSGVPADRLLAAGFGENQPLEPGTTPEVRARNRRIELKLTER